MQILLRLANVQTALRMPISRDQFVEDVKVFEASGAHCLHLSCHGNSDCIEFTDGSTMAWSDLFNVLKMPIEDKILSISSCGATAKTELIDLFGTGERHPSAVIGCPDDISWSDAFLSWGTIYFALAHDGDDAYDVMTRALASISLARGCEFHFAFYPDASDPSDSARRVITLSAKDCLDEYCEDRSDNSG